MRFSKHVFFSQVLKVALQIMLFQKIAALFAFMVFTSQGVIGRPYPLRRDSIGDDVDPLLSSLKFINAPDVEILSGAVTGDLGSLTGDLGSLSPGALGGGLKPKL